MNYFLWLIKIALFALLLSFAVKNTDMVALRYYLGYEWQAPLILVLLLFFCLGAAFGIVAGLTQVFRQRREISALKRQLRVAGEARSEPAPPVPPGAA